MEKKRRFLQTGETLEDLQLQGLHIIQKEQGFRFGVDAVLLSDFARVRGRDSVLDLCSGTGIVPLLLAGKTTSKHLVGLEIQRDFHEMAVRSVALNGLGHRVRMVEGDLCDQTLLKALGRFDVVTVNPPYKKPGSGIPNPEDALALARHEVALTLEDVVVGARLALKDQGRLFVVHRPERLLDLLHLMRVHRVEPKRLRMVHPKAKAAPTMILVEGVRDARPNLKVEAPLCIYEEDGSYTEEIRRIYGDDRR